jgi:large subunit ribosomal protein L25
MTLTLTIHAREKAGKSAARGLRNQGMIPGILYGGKEPNVLLSLDPRDILKGLDHTSFYTTVFKFEVNGKKEQALCKEVQFHPVTDQPIHVDFYRVLKDTKLRIKVPVVMTHESASPGLKQGGILNIVHHSLEVLCSAENIPEAITVDLTGLEIGASVQLSQMQLPKGVIPAHPERDNTIATIVAPSAKG